MRDGMYGIDFTTGGDAGTGVFIFEGGRVYGADRGTARYDGSYEMDQSTRMVQLRLKVTFPPNVMSVFGLEYPFEWSVDCEAALDPLKEEDQVLVATSIGQRLMAHYLFLRPLPGSAAYLQ
jgi:hypothetical protein